MIDVETITFYTNYVFLYLKTLGKISLYQFKNKTKRGFTLLELLIVLAMLSVLITSSVFVTYGFFVRTQVDNTVLVLVETLRRAQTISRNAVEDSAWGLKINEDTLVLFKANDGDGDGNPDSYSQTSTRDTSFDKQYYLPGEVEIDNTGQVEIIFNKITGEPRIGGVLTIQINSSSSYSRQVQINPLGTIDY